MANLSKDEDFPYIDDTMRRFESLTSMIKVYPEAKISQDFYCPKCGKHPTNLQDNPIAYSALIPYFGAVDKDQKGDTFYWYETVDCDNCKKPYIFKNQNF